MSSSNPSGSPGNRYRWLALTFAGGFAVALLIVIALKYSSKDSLAAPFASPQFTGQFDGDGIDVYFALTSRRDEIVDEALKVISENWHSGSPTMLVEIAHFASTREALTKIYDLANAKTGQSLGSNTDKWHQWLWKQEYTPHPRYAQFKKELYEKIDPRFAEYYRVTKDSKIRLDEIRWGGVIRDGIPPLKDPKMLAADDADYLADTDVVFGIDLNGDARCYPKRILAWHEMFKDTIGGESVCGVY